MLTPNQENYCKNRALKEMSQQEAYRGAYKADRMSYDSVAVEACRLEATPKIALRIEELRAEQTADILKDKKWTRDKAYTELTWLIEQAKNEIKNTNSVSGSVATAIINSIKELNSIYEVTAETTDKESDGFIEALNGQACEVWNDEENGDIPV
jgi:hypothetical protein